MQLAMVAVLAGVMLAATGAGQAWARVSAAVELPGDRLRPGSAGPS